MSKMSKPPNSASMLLPIIDLIVTSYSVPDPESEGQQSSIIIVSMMQQLTRRSLYYAALLCHSPMELGWQGQCHDEI